jgi:hypothetical protein
MNPLSNVLIGSVISFVVSALKRVPFIKDHPKTACAVLSTVVPASVALYGQVKGVEVAPVQDLLAALATQFASSVTTHETVTHTANSVIDTVTGVQ